MADDVLEHLRAIEGRVERLVELGYQLRRCERALARAQEDIGYLLELVRRSAVELDAGGATVPLPERLPTVPPRDREETVEEPKMRSLGKEIDLRDVLREVGRLIDLLAERA